MMKRYTGVMFALLLLPTLGVLAEEKNAVFGVAKEWAAQDPEKEVDFVAGTRLADRLREIGGPEAELWRFRVIARALQAIDPESAQKALIAAWLAKHQDEVVYSEPSGEYYVVQERVWELHEKSRKDPLAEEIAWEAANTPLAGECEGYLACYTEADLRGVGSYLGTYPRGKWVREALDGLYWLQETPSAADFPLDPADIGTCKKIFATWRRILEAIPGSEKERQGLEKLAKAYKIG